MLRLLWNYKICYVHMPPHMLTFMFACCATWTIVALHFVEIMFTCHSHLIEFMFTCIWIIILSSILSMPLYYRMPPSPHFDHLLVLFWFVSGRFLITFGSLSATFWSLFDHFLVTFRVPFKVFYPIPLKGRKHWLFLRKNNKKHKPVRAMNGKRGFSVYSMYIPCIFSVYSMHVQCIFNVCSMYMQGN